MARTTDYDSDSGNAAGLLTPLPEAVLEIQRRRADATLVRKVEEYLNNDIPEYFQGPQPVLYLARHIATPNFETLRFIEIAQSFGLPVIISQDPHDKFVTNNSLKRALGKMPIVRCVSSDHREQIEYFTIVDFEKAQGTQLKDIKTIFDIPLVKFHNDLLTEVYPRAVTVVDDSAWINRNDRGDLVEHYKKFLALCLVHGIMFEYYPEEDAFLVENTLKPAVAFLTEKFGVPPLITSLVEDDMVHIRDWDAYPSILYSQVKNACKGMCFDKLIVPPTAAGHLSALSEAPSCNSLTQ